VAFMAVYHSDVTIVAFPQLAYSCCMLQINSLLKGCHIIMVCEALGLLIPESTSYNNPENDI
jgi:hypothetical protein